MKTKEIISYFPQEVSLDLFKLDLTEQYRQQQVSILL